MKEFRKGYLINTFNKYSYILENIIQSDVISTSINFLLFSLCCQYDDVFLNVKLAVGLSSMVS